MADRRRSRAHAFALVAAGLGLCALVALRVLTDPAPEGSGTHVQLGLEPCGWLVAWNVPCPGCGVTTAMSLFAHGRLSESLATQPFGFAVAAGLVAAFAAALVAHCAGRDLGRALVRIRWAPWILAAALAMTLAWVWKLVRHLAAA